MKITEKDINEGIAVVNSYQLESCAGSGVFGDTISDRLLKTRRKVVEALLESMEFEPISWRHNRKKDRKKLRKRLVAEVRYRSRCGFSISTWFLIARLVYQIAPILWKWWRDRQAQEGAQ